MRDDQSRADAIRSLRRHPLVAVMDPPPPQLRADAHARRPGPSRPSSRSGRPDNLGDLLVDGKGSDRRYAASSGPLERLERKRHPALVVETARPIRRLP